MTLTDPIQLLSLAFANALFISVICIGIILWAFRVGVKARNDYAVIKRDSNALARCLGEPIDDANTVEQINASTQDGPLRVRTTALIRDSATLEGSRYRLTQADPLDGIINEYLDTRTLAAYPNIFVGVGLLITFLIVFLLGAFSSD